MKFIPDGVTRTVARQVLLAKKTSPSWMFAAGVVGIVATTVLASKATLKLEDTLEDLLPEDPRVDPEHNAKTYIHNALVVGKLYAPTIAVGVLSIGLLTGSHRTLSKRNVALTAAYAGLEKAYAEYRQRVLEAVGPDKEREFRYRLEDCEIEDENGKKKKTKVVSPGSESLYARFFDQNSTSWSPTSEYNMLFLRCQQNYFNDRLRARGHVFLNEVYDGLGLERSKAGAVVGWVHDGGGDNFIDFGVFDSPANDRFYDFVTGNDGIWVDFNVDGVIYDKI
jgi:hypothetical protein